MNADPNGEMPPFEAIDDVTIPIDRPPRRRTRQNLVDLTKIDRLPPHSIEAEQGALGCILLDSPSALPICQAKLTDLSFYDLRHQTLYHHLLKLADSGSPVDLITVSSALRDAKELDAIGGLAYLSSLQDATPSSANVAYYVDILDQKNTQRRLLSAATEIVARIYEPTEATHESQLESAKNLFDAALQPTRYRFGALRSFFSTEDELESEDLPEPVQIVEGLLCMGDMAMMGGQSKSMKSWLSQHLAICVTYGLHFLNRKCTKGNVLYVNLELKPHTIRYRNRAIKSAKAICFPSSCGLVFLNLRHSNATAKTLRGAIKEYCERTGTKFSLIIIDPFYMLAQGVDENAAGEMSALLGEIATISMETGAAVLMPAHFAKGNSSQKESIDRISGSGVIARNMDAIFTLTRLNEPKTFTFEATLRALPPVEPIGLRWEAPVFVIDAELDTEDLLQPKKTGRPSKTNTASVIDLLPSSGLTRSAWKFAVMTSLSLSKTTAYDLTGDAIDDGLAIKGTKNIYFPSPKILEERRKEAVKKAPPSGKSEKSEQLFPDTRRNPDAYRPSRNP